MQIFTSLALGCGNQKPVVYLYFNPHPFKIGEQEVSVPLVLRYQRILKIIEDFGSRNLDEDPLSLVYLYYDVSEDGDLVVANHAEYEVTARELIKEILVD